MRFCRCNCDRAGALKSVAIEISQIGHGGAEKRRKARSRFVIVPSLDGRAQKNLESLTVMGTVRHMPRRASAGFLMLVACPKSVAIRNDIFVDSTGGYGHF